MPLSERLRPIQGTSVRALSEAPAPRSAFLQRRHPIESTYSASLRSAVQSAADVPVRAGGDPIPAGTSHEGESFRLLPISSQRAEYNAGAPFVPEDQLSFYSRVRKQERLDETAYGAAASRSVARGSQRTVEMLNKRQTAPEFRPPQQDWSVLLASMAKQHRVNPHYSPNTSSRGSINGEETTTLSHNEDSVRNYRPPYASAYQTEFRAPQAILPRNGLDDSFRTQRCALSTFSSSRDLFRGTPKSYPEGVLPNFMGHVPHHSRNREKILGDGVEILRPHGKCTVNLASSSGADSGGVRSASPKERSEASMSATMMGFYTQQAIHASEAERRVNYRVV